MTAPTRLTRLHQEAHKLRSACQRLRAAAMQFEIAMAQVDRDLAAITPRRKPAARPQLSLVKETDHDQTV